MQLLRASGAEIVGEVQKGVTDPMTVEEAVRACCAALYPEDGQDVR
jgi:hypothetical protein